MKRKLEKISASFLFYLYSFLQLFIKNQKITNKKIIYGALIVGLTSVISGCHRHKPMCYSVRLVDNIETTDSTKINYVK
jgi:hypothetical protein